MFPEEAESHRLTCTKFVNSVLKNMPDLAKRLKMHLLLHLVDNMLTFGPSSSVSTERYICIYMQHCAFIHFYCRFESFNSFIRGQNIYSNRRAPSRDIAYNFAVLEHVRSICSGALFNSTYSRCVV